MSRHARLGFRSRRWRRLRSAWLFHRWPGHLAARQRSGCRAANGKCLRSASPDAPLPKKPDDGGGATAGVSASAPHDIDFVGPRDIVQELSWTGEPATMDTAEPIAFEPVVAGEATVADAADATIYSVGDDDVTPPVATYPRLAPARECSRRRSLDHRVARRRDGTRRIREARGAATRSRRGNAGDRELERRQDLALSSGGKGWAAREIPNARAAVADDPIDVARGGESDVQLILHDERRRGHRGASGLVVASRAMTECSPWPRARQRACHGPDHRRERCGQGCGRAICP